MTNPAVLSRKEVDRWCRELVHENKEKDKVIAELVDVLIRVKELLKLSHTFPREFESVRDAEDLIEGLRKWC